MAVLGAFKTHKVARHSSSVLRERHKQQGEGRSPHVPRYKGKGEVGKVRLIDVPFGGHLFIRSPICSCWNACQDRAAEVSIDLSTNLIRHMLT